MIRELISVFLITDLIINRVFSGDVCANKQCQCSDGDTLVHCDSKGWKNLDGIDFPSKVITLTLIRNQLKFDTVTDRAKIENLSLLIDLSINQNILGTIPPFNQAKIRFLSLQDNSLVSAEFPSSYSSSLLKTISLSNNKIRSINVEDFLSLRDSQLTKLSIDSSSISKIDQNSFVQLKKLQALSLKNNQLKSCEFLSNLPSLSSIKLDGNQFTSLPQQLATQEKIKIFSFKHNLISIIDELSPLSRWSKINTTNVQVFLANNTFDCCLSLWFIRFLKTSPQFVPDASLLTCATPLSFTGKLLIKLNPDDMNCGSDIPSKSWWTIGRIIGIAIGPACLLILGVAMITMVYIYNRRYPSRSGYIPISEHDDLYSNTNSLFSERLTIPIGEDDDQLLTHNGFGSGRSLAQSDVLTQATTEGIYATDGSVAGDSHIQEAVSIPRSD
ncbi:unnamed protein product [Rotaria socialis]|uniref:Uncharacterized protein n=1 Tax=Rotaria socialis TaxID=392032 RepID=A0A820U3L0_9BILA|nr:unnamed protein product [Rotaria socialis]CAF4480914.1 unnamed protein product [Rotaria socialis]